MRIILTGSTGFIGKALLAYLRSEDIDVVCIGRLSGNIVLSKQLEDMGRVDGCIHLASLFLSSHSEEQVAPIVSSNVAFGTQVVDAAVRLGCRWFINTGTYWTHYNDCAYSPVNLYAATKQAFSDILVYYRESAGLRTVTLELTDTYGPDDPRKKLIGKWCEILDTSQELLMSAGKQEVELVHRDDVVRAFLLLVKLLNDNDVRVPGIGEVYSLPTGEAMPLRDLASVFESATGGKLPIVWGGRPERIREMMKVVHHGRAIPGWKPSISLIKGFAAVYASYLQGSQ